MGTVDWQRVSTAKPCPICAHTHWCSTSPDGALVFCMREHSDWPSKTGEQSGWIHRLGPDTRANGHADGHHASVIFTGPTVKHELRDAGGTVVAVHCRRPLTRDGEAGKKVWWEQPNGTPTLKGTGLTPTTLPLYGADELVDADRGAVVVVCEGEKATDAVRRMGLMAVGTVTGAGSIPDDDVLRVLVGFDACLWPDNDDDGRRHMAKIADRLLVLGARVRVLDWAGAPAKGDAADFVAAGGGKDELRGLYRDAVVVEPTDEPAESTPQAADATFPMTDLGNAQRLVARHGEDIRWCDAMGRWFHWGGVRWAQVGPTILQDLAIDTVVALYAEAEATTDPEQRVVLTKWAKTSSSGRSIGSMVGLTKTVTGPIAVDADDLDADPMLLGVEDGVVDLRTGRGRASERADLITKSCRAPFDPAALCPRWEAFLARIFAGDADVVAYVQRAAGYSLTGKTSERVIFIGHGSGTNGKTTFLEVLAHILGTYAMSTPVETLMARKDPGIPNDLARIKSARFVSATETERGAKLAEARIKAVTGGDRMTARFLHQEFFDFVPQCKLWFATNHRPEIASGGKAIWKRVRLIPFEVEIPESEIDPDLKAKLLAEAPGILAWMVRGCLEWQRMGLKEPESIRRANKGYEEDEDVLGAFVEDRAVLEPDVWVSIADLYAEFENWREAHGEERMSAKAFSQSMAERKGIKRSRQPGTGMRGFSGVRLPERPTPKKKRQPDGIDE